MARIFNILFTLSLSLVIVGCNKDGGNSSSATTQIDKVVEQAKTECVDKLKNRMKKKDFSFEESAESPLGDDVRAANLAIKQSSFSKTDYTLNYPIDKNGHPIEIGLSAEGKQGDDNVEMSMAIVEANVVTKNLFSIKIDLDRTNKNQKRMLRLSQQMDVTADCKLKLVRTEKVLKVQIGNILKIGEIEENADHGAGSVKAKEGQAEVPTGAELFGAPDYVLGENDDLSAFISKNKEKVFYTAFSADMPLAQFVLQETKPVTHFDPLINKKSLFHGFIMHMSIGANTLVDVNSMASDESSFHFSRSLNSETWHVTEALWDQARLLPNKTDDRRKIEVDSKTYKSGGPFRIDVRSSTEFDYANLAAYWDVEKKELLTGDRHGLKFHYVLTTHPLVKQHSVAPLVPDQEKASHPYLKESSAVQISNPEVQMLIGRLKERRNLDRAQMAAEVLKLVQEKLKFDNDSIEQGLVYPLTTSDILQRSKGVCQHFANLFTAIARGLGIPTRMVLGYYLEEKSLMPHAWNEIEIRDGVWLPVEPQGSKLGLNSSYYLPFAEGNYLEDLKADGEKWATLLKISMTEFYLIVEQL